MGFTYEKDMLTVVEAIQKSKPFLYGNYYYKGRSSKLEIPIRAMLALDSSTQMAHKTPWWRTMKSHTKKELKQESRCTFKVT